MSGFTIKLEGLAQVQTQLKEYTKEVEKQVTAELNDFGVKVVKNAKTNAPTDEAHLKNLISYIPAEPGKLEIEVVVNANYAAYIEFGTRRFAEATVASLPADWQTFAAEFKGPGGGTFAELVERITNWVHRKGLGSGHNGKGTIGVTGTYSVKTGRRTGGKAIQEKEDKQAAYVIALSIIKNGIKAHPFLYPAVRDNKAVLIENLKKMLVG